MFTYKYTQRARTCSIGTALARLSLRLAVKAHPTGPSACKSIKIILDQLTCLCSIRQWRHVQAADLYKALVCRKDSFLVPR